MREKLLEAVGFEADSGVAKRFSPILNLGHEDHLVPSFWVDTKIMQFPDEVHLHLSVRVAVEGVIDLLAEDLVVEGVIEG